MSAIELPWDRPAPEPGADARPNAAGMDRAQLEDLVGALGEKPYRARQIFEGLYHHRWTGWSSFTSLSKELRARLKASVDLAWPGIVESAASEVSVPLVSCCSSVFAAASERTLSSR